MTTEQRTKLEYLAKRWRHCQAVYEVACMCAKQDYPGERIAAIDYVVKAQRSYHDIRRDFVLALAAISPYDADEAISIYTELTGYEAVTTQAAHAVVEHDQADAQLVEVRVAG